MKVKTIAIPVGGISVWGVTLAASLTALIWTPPDLQAAIDPFAPPGLVSAAGVAGQTSTAQAQSEAPVAKTEYQSQPPPGYGGWIGAIQDWLARANRDYQGVVIKKLSTPQDGVATTDEIARKIEETKTEAAKVAAEADDASKNQAADEKRRDAAPKAEADRKAAAAKTKSEPSAKVDGVKRQPPARSEPAPSATAEDVAAKAESQRLANEREERTQREADEKRKAAAEARRLQEEQRQADERVAEQRRRDAEAAARAEPRRRTIVLTTEPIPRPAPPSSMYRPELASARSLQAAAAAEYGDNRPARRRMHRNARVKGWIGRRHQPAVCRAAGRRIKPPGRYVVGRGDSLWRISKRHYSKGRLYGKIYRANRRVIRDPDVIYPCQRFHVPRRRG